MVIKAEDTIENVSMVRPPSLAKRAMDAALVELNARELEEKIREANSRAGLLEEGRRYFKEIFDEEPAVEEGGS